MKIKNILKIFVIFGLLFICKNVYAASASIYANKTSAYVGDSVTVTVSYNAASWNLHVSGAVNDSEVGYNSDGVNQGGSRSWNINTSSPGTYSVSLSGDVTDQNDTNSGVGGSVSVTISERPADPTPAPTPSTPSTPNTPSQPQEEPKSNNNKIKEITIEGYELVKVDDNNYTLSVDNNISKININATPEDGKSTITGIGEHELEVGENIIEIICQAEDGSQNKIIIIVTREEEKIVTPTKKPEKTVEKTTKNELDISSILLIVSLILNVLLIVVIILIIKNKKNKRDLKEISIPESEPIFFDNKN